MQTDRYSRAQAQRTGYDAGLRSHLLSVYNRMTAGVLITAIVAWAISVSPALQAVFVFSPLSIVFILAPFGIIMFGFNPRTMAASRLKVTFGILSALYGVSFSVIAMAYAAADVASAFFITTSMFAVLSIVGYTTKKDLSAMASFLIMALWGLLIVSILGVFMTFSSGMELVIDVGAVVIFSGLTAWHTQQAKLMYNGAHGEEINSRLAWMSALMMYMDFINLFSYILRLTSRR